MKKHGFHILIVNIMKKLKLIIPFCLILIVLIAFAFVSNSHHTDLSYILWKNHLNPYYSQPFRYFNVDVNFRMSFLGKTKEYTLKYFPNSKFVKVTNSYSLYEYPWLKNVKVMILDDSNWAAKINNGIVEKIVLLKGYNSRH